MPKIIAVETTLPPYRISQEQVARFAKNLFSNSFRDINRLLKVFQNGDIESRYFVKDLEWFSRSHTFQEKNDAFIENAVSLGSKAIQACIESQDKLNYDNIDAIITVCTTGLATPSIEARIMNQLPFPENVKRIPIWGLGCAGGVSGLSRAHEYCLAYPDANVLVLSIELCSLTFQHGDHSKSNLVGTSLFGDGVACALVCGDKSMLVDSNGQVFPAIVTTQSTLMKDSLDVMGWDIRNEGLFVVFSKDIPTIVKNWLGPNVSGFLEQNQLQTSDLKHFVAHPGGKKVLEAYQEALNFSSDMIELSLKVLKKYGNMSSATVLYVLKEFLDKEIASGQYGLAAALGPGFSSELVLLRWD
ncbi:alkylresorcinol/alkylpyrone synthase [Bacillus pakistanensis]|uniref:Alkylresorcinol/alkylpyrone synthase n=1 Tax=Rossellomorea pakistanensis TaxID=992288 RepID=A0ABS2N8U5_9BACI|nr:3-oxoacyl-[acyl-carrier-protein] synthase III C-terminal domain-containing protein [Bacillus pakistanensis]MBM7584286.1 alkylresorcinol/alkylpyrone synthase [Bacillus pakistanensis]